jgi:hypothetical protein
MAEQRLVIECWEPKHHFREIGASHCNCGRYTKAELQSLGMERVIMHSVPPADDQKGA